MRFIHTFFFLQFGVLSIFAQSDFDKYFLEDKLRLDYSITGNSDEARIHDEIFYLDSNWGGSKINTIDTFLYGELFLEVIDSFTNSLIFSRGYSSLFMEWQTIEEADSIEKTFIESVIMPFPRKTIQIKISERSDGLSFRCIRSIYFNPENSKIEKKDSPDFIIVKEILKNGIPFSKVDLVFLSAGYNESDSTKFFSDAKKIADKLFLWDPYSAFQDAFNIYAVFASSEYIPLSTQNDTLNGQTIFSVHFNTFNSERYLTTENISEVRDILSGIPYDQMCIIVNSEDYGGGGIYNFLTLFTSDNEYSEFLFHHEFGHGFASLADEYYSSLTPYTSYFDLRFEPYQPNITTLVNFDVKWNKMISDTVPVPTPDLIEYSGVVGVFEGAGYTVKGVYRPYHDCSMKSKLNNAFCPVCRREIEQMILFYSAE